jgi:DNA-binding XRE family transcriptional regulator
MESQDLSMDKKKEFAKLLFINGKMNQKQIASEVDVSEVTMSKWVNENKWDSLRESIVATNAEQIAFLQRQLTLLNEAGIRALEDDDPATNPDTDGIIKLTKAIHYLQTKTSTGQMYQTGTEFISFLQRINPALAKDVAPLFNQFIKSQL